MDDMNRLCLGEKVSMECGGGDSLLVANNVCVELGSEISQRGSDNVEYNIISHDHHQLVSQYPQLWNPGQQRQQNLSEACKAYVMQRERESAELAQWVKDKEQYAQVQVAEVPQDVDLEQVEVMQKKFYDFQSDLKANEVMLAEMNVIAMQLMSLGQTEAAVKIQTQLEDLNQKWNSLQQVTQEKAEKLGSAHQVQRFHRDVDETKDWIAEKDEALSKDDLGKDLRTVQGLHQKHEGLERDLAALGEKIKSLDDTATKLISTHPESAETIYSKQKEINLEWSQLQRKANERKEKLLDSYDLQRFLSDYRDLMGWINSMMSLVSNDECATDVTGAESFLERHQEHMTVMNESTRIFQGFELFGKQLLESRNYASVEIVEKLESLAEAWQELVKQWIARRVVLDQCLELQLFYRDCEQAENWMQRREAVLAVDKDGHWMQESGGPGTNNVEALIKKPEDFDKAISSQEKKIARLTQFADQLVAHNHYRAPEISNKMQEVLVRWEKLKDAWIEKRSKMSESQRLQQFCRDADEIENWITEKLQYAKEESYKDASNIQSKHQKHQAFEAELAANADRIQAVLAMGHNLIEKRQCAGSGEAVEARLQSIANQWETLTMKTSEKSLKLKEANKQRTYIAALKDIDFWLRKVESLLTSEDSGKDLATVQNLIKKHQLVQADITGLEERVNDMNGQADSLIESKQFDAVAIQEKRMIINTRFERVKNLAAHRQSRLNEAFTLHQFFRDVNVQDKWILQKKLTLWNGSYGRKLKVLKRQKKQHKRIEKELQSHEPAIQAVQEAGFKLMDITSFGYSEVEFRLRALSQAWSELKQLSREREEKLETLLEKCKEDGEGDCCWDGCNWETAQKFFKWIAIVGLVAAVIYVLSLAQQRYQRELQYIECFECISFEGMTLKDPGLPYEQNCLDAPKNTRKCLQGQVCGLAKRWNGTAARVQRSCATGTKLGCWSESKQANSTYCFCDKDLCMNRK